MTATGAPSWAYLWRRFLRIAPWRRIHVRPAWQVLGTTLAALGAHLAGMATIWLAVTLAGMLAGRAMLAMAQTNTVLHSRVQSLEKRHKDLSTHVTAVAAAGTTATGNIASLFSDFSSLSGLVGNASFLANLSMLPHQTTGNATAFNATNFANLCNAVNNLQGNLQSNGFES